MTSKFKNTASVARFLRKLGYSSTANWREIDRKHYQTWVTGRANLGWFINAMSDPSVERGRPAVADGMERAAQLAARLLDEGYCVASHVEFRQGLDRVYYRYSSGSVILVD